MTEHTLRGQSRQRTAGVTAQRAGGEQGATLAPVHRQRPGLHQLGFGPEVPAAYPPQQPQAQPISRQVDALAEGHDGVVVGTDRHQVGMDRRAILLQGMMQIGQGPDRQTRGTEQLEIVEIDPVAGEAKGAQDGLHETEAAPAGGLRIGHPQQIGLPEGAQGRARVAD